jgi:eukaryotic-like serine/threonine-protein kinase
MPLAPRTLLGPYEIVAPIGAGGMGEVYKARDTRLDRAVAVKILPAEMGADADRRRRFEQEARSVAALNHPNIVAVYDVGVQDDVAYLVEELVDGEPLSGAIERGELTLRKSLALAGQVADALAAAHQAGIIHRDLKPDNIMVTAQGRAKVLDFGLARQVGALAASAGEETKTFAVTQAGMVLGTLGYMSPEQARGQVADARSDIFAFGAVAYEMVSGRRAFQRATAADTISAILKEDPPEFPDTVPAAFRQVVLHCLEKDPAHRFQSAQDLSFAISALSGSSVSNVPAAAPAARGGRKYWPVWTIGIAGLLGGLAAGARLATGPEIDLARQHHSLLVSDTSGHVTPRWSPDGKSFTYASTGRLLIQGLESPTPTELLAGLNHYDLLVPFFSPDGARVWYTNRRDGRGVWSIAVAGGEPQAVIRNLGGFEGMDGAALSPDGRSLVIATEKGGVTTLAISSPPGSAPQPLAGAPVLRSTFSRVRIRFSHHGDRLLAVFTNSRRAEDDGLWTMPWPGGKGEARRVGITLQGQEVPGNADWLLDDRHMVMATAAADNLLIGGRLLVIESESGRTWQLTADNAAAADPAVAADGRILYSRTLSPYDLVQTPVDGSAQRELLATDWVESSGVWSRVADEFVYIGDRGGESAVWIASADGSWQRRVASAKDVGESSHVTFRSAEFSPDGKRLCYVAGRRVWVSAAAGGNANPVTPADQASVTPTWSADGRWIAYRANGGLYKVRVGSPEPAVRLADSVRVPAAWSPGGKWITAEVEGGIGIVSADGAQKRVCFRRPFSGWSTSVGWSRDGATLFLLDREGDHVRLLAFDVERGAERVIRDYPADGRNYSELGQYSGRLSPSRDGKYLLGSRWEPRSSVWLLEGVTPPRPWWRVFR